MSPCHCCTFLLPWTSIGSNMNPESRMALLNQQPGLQFGGLCEDCHAVAKPTSWFCPCHEVVYKI